MALPYATEDQLKQLKTQLANVGNKSVKTKEELDALKGTDGQLVYCQEDSKLYIFKKDKWEKVGSDSVGKKVGYVELDAEQSKAFLGNDSSNFELTESQIDTVIDNDVIKITVLDKDEDSGEDSGETPKITLDFFKQLYNVNFGTESVTYHFIYSILNGIIVILMIGRFEEESMSNLYQIKSSPSCTTEDNGKVLKVVDGDAKWSNLAFTENKTIPLFGKHSILVPKNSADSNINLYTHYIRVSSTSSMVTMFLTILSSRDSAVDNLTDLYTLIGTEMKYIPCTGYLLVEGNYRSIVGIDWHGTIDYSTILYLDSANGLDYRLMSDVVKSSGVKDVATPV